MRVDHRASPLPRWPVGMVCASPPAAAAQRPENQGCRHKRPAPHPSRPSDLSGTVTVWAMGTEGEALGKFSEGLPPTSTRT